MRRRRRPARTLVAAALAGSLAAGPVAQTAGGSADPWSGWKTLRLEARPLFLFFGQVEMTLTAEAGRRRLETVTRASFLGAELARSRTRTTIDAATGRTLEYHDLGRERGRRYLFGESGYTVQKLRPRNGPDAPVEQWEVTRTRRFDYPAASPGGPAARVFDYYGMILHLREAPLDKPGDEITVWVATSDGPEPYRVRVGEVRRSERAFKDLATGRSRREPVREFRLRISPADPARAEEGFLRMEGDTEIWVEARTRTLLEIEGKIPKVPGRVEVALAALG